MTPPMLQVEVRLTPQCSIEPRALQERIRYFLVSTVKSLGTFQEIPLHECTDQVLRTSVEQLWIAEWSGQGSPPPGADEDDMMRHAVENVDMSIHLYQIQSLGAVEEYSEGMGQAEAVMMAHHWTLPCQELEGVWEKYGKLLEINSHSLFSKWFSESGKMVQKMFDQIWSMVEDEDAFVCVLIDEVESLAAARKAALSGNEPSDSLRAVNALLTQIDRLKQRKNVLILTTSNITEAIGKNEA
ncbi:Pachytene checkpoint protein 2 [Mortierella alpina]|nr:Pachytene checkpoint protein 2 [Mortierella alpina]